MGLTNLKNLQGVLSLTNTKDWGSEELILSDFGDGIYRIVNTWTEVRSWAEKNDECQQQGVSTEKGFRGLYQN